MENKFKMSVKYLVIEQHLGVRVFIVELQHGSHLELRNLLRKGNLRVDKHNHKDNEL